MTETLEIQEGTGLQVPGGDVVVQGDLVVHGKLCVEDQDQILASMGLGDSKPVRITVRVDDDREIVLMVYWADIEHWLRRLWLLDELMRRFGNMAGPDQYAALVSAIAGEEE
jgi:hypothetical protein